MNKETLEAIKKEIQDEQFEIDMMLPTTGDKTKLKVITVFAIENILGNHTTETNGEVNFKFDKVENNKLPCKEECEAIVQTYIDSYRGIIPKVPINDFIINEIQKLMNKYRELQQNHTSDIDYKAKYDKLIDDYNLNLEQYRYLNDYKAMWEELQEYIYIEQSSDEEFDFNSEKFIYHAIYDKMQDIEEAYGDDNDD